MDTTTDRSGMRSLAEMPSVLEVRGLEASSRYARACGLLGQTVAEFLAGRVDLAALRWAKTRADVYTMTPAEFDELRREGAQQFHDAFSGDPVDDLDDAEFEQAF